MSRECGDCYACCTGILWFNDKSMTGEDVIASSNMPVCSKYESGCTIYPDRPITCRSFRCSWLEDEGLPESLKPNKCGFITYQNEDEEGKHTFIRQTKYEEVDQVQLVWAIWWAVSQNEGSVQVNTQYNGELLFRGNKLS